MTHHRVGMASHALIFSPDGRLLTIKRDGNPYLRGFWSIPAGHVESGETALSACARELMEEVGLDISTEDLRFVLVQQKSGTDGEERVDFFFVATCSRPDLAHAASPREVADIRWSIPDKLPEPFAPYVAAALAYIREGATFSTWGL